MKERRPLLGVSACLFRGAEILLVRRRRPPFAGRLSMPGGKVAFGEHLADAIRREVAEETGLILHDLLFHRLHEALDQRAGVHAVIAVYRSTTEILVEAVAGDDAEAIVMTPVRALKRLEAAEMLTDGLADVVMTAFDAHIAAK